LSRSPSAVVIGSGPYGLSVAAHLRHLGVDTQVFGEPLEAWRHNMPTGMFLKSTPSASSICSPIPGYRLEDFCRAKGVRPLREDQAVPIELFIRYGRWFQEQLVPVEQQRVVSTTRAGGSYELTLESGERFRTPALVVAAGHVQFSHLPSTLRALAGESDSPLVTHASQHRDFSGFAGREVVVVGAGQSALESAALLHEAGAKVQLLVRESKVLWAGPPEIEPRPLKQRLLKPESPLGPGWSHVASRRGAAAIRLLPSRARLELVKRILGPAGSWWLRERVEDKVTVRTSHTIKEANRVGDRVVLVCQAPGGSVRIAADHVIAATGYKVDVDAMRFLDHSVRAGIFRVDGYPRLDESFESAVPGLFFAGLPSAATFGPLMRFVCGTDFAAPRLARGVARSVAGRLVVAAA
jgi:cation diffusion facilitator CzcD-associated flavoprotein CzcO